MGERSVIRGFADEICLDPSPVGLLAVIGYFDCLHIEDAASGEGGEMHPAGDADGNVPATLAAFRQRGFQASASLEHI